MLPARHLPHAALRVGGTAQRATFGEAPRFQEVFTTSTGLQGIVLGNSSAAPAAVAPSAAAAVAPHHVVFKIPAAMDWKNHLLDEEAPRLAAAYNGATRVDYAAVATNQLSQLNAESYLVINAHGMECKIAGESASTWYTRLKDRGFAGCKEIHIYACQTGLSADCFGPTLSALIKADLGLFVPVWAPMGNCVYNTVKARYMIKRPGGADPPSYFAKGKGWAKGVPSTMPGRGKIVLEGAPTVPNPAGFVPVPLPAADEDFGIEVIDSG